MTKSWTLEQLRLAEELAYPSNVSDILRDLYSVNEHHNDWILLANDIRRQGLLSTIFSYSRASYKKAHPEGTLGDLFDTLISRLLINHL